MMRTMPINRRRFLAIMTVLTSAVLWPLNAFSAAWRHTAFEATQLGEAEQALGITATTSTKLIDIVAPDKAENGAIVQLEIASRVPNTESMSILVDHNPTPLIAQYVFGLGALPQLVTRIKMADTSEIKVIVKADGQYWSATKKVIVLENGCG